MRSNTIAVCLISALLALAAPAFAADQAGPNFTLPRVTAFGPMHNYTLFAPLPPGQQAAPAAQNQKKRLTTAGKVLKWVGVGLMATGGLVLVATAAASHSCGPYAICDSTGRDDALAFGGGTAGIGAALFFIGIHRTQ